MIPVRYWWAVYPLGGISRVTYTQYKTMTVPKGTKFYLGTREEAHAFSRKNRLNK